MLDSVLFKIAIYFVPLVLINFKAPISYQDKINPPAGYSGNNKAFSVEKGIIKCPDAKPGQKAILNGKEITAVDRELLIQKRNSGADLTCVCTSLVTDMSQLFMGNPQGKEKKQVLNGFNDPLSHWDVSNVTNMTGMFKYSNFNGDISNWNVNNDTIMSHMFNKNALNDVDYDIRKYAKMYFNIMNNN
jgi:hypothetical protein